MSEKFVDCFREVINTADPIANSLMSKDMPPAVKILADWGRKACNEIDSKNKIIDDLAGLLSEVLCEVAVSCTLKYEIKQALKQARGE